MLLQLSIVLLFPLPPPTKKKKIKKKEGTMKNLPDFLSILWPYLGALLSIFKYLRGTRLHLLSSEVYIYMHSLFAY